MAIQHAAFAYDNAMHVLFFCSITFLIISFIRMDFGVIVCQCELINCLVAVLNNEVYYSQI